MLTGWREWEHSGDEAAYLWVACKSYESLRQGDLTPVNLTSLCAREISHRQRGHSQKRQDPTHTSLFIYLYISYFFTFMIFKISIVEMSDQILAAQTRGTTETEK